MKPVVVTEFSTQSKYYPLHTYLAAAQGTVVQLSFQEIEAILGFGLPVGARSHSAWWGNSKSGHSQSRAWMLAGWRVQVDVSRETATFTR
jgi:hypothetical protein